MEAEYTALHQATKTGLWIQNLLESLAIPIQIWGPQLTVNVDNQAAITYSKSTNANSRAKHIRVQYHFVRELVSKQQLVINYIASTDMPADALTKPLTRDNLIKACKNIGLHNGCA